MQQGGADLRRPRSARTLGVADAADESPDDAAVAHGQRVRVHLQRRRRDADLRGRRRAREGQRRKDSDEAPAEAGKQRLRRPLLPFSERRPEARRWCMKWCERQHHQSNNRTTGETTTIHPAGLSSSEEVEAAAARQDEILLGLEELEVGGHVVRGGHLLSQQGGKEQGGTQSGRHQAASQGT